MVLGSGNIGWVVAELLAKKYKVTLAAIQHTVKVNSSINMLVLDATDEKILLKTIKSQKINAVVSCLPHFITKNVAKVVLSAGKDYFDLTEDVESTKFIAKLSQSSKSMVVPQCGLAPGLVSIVAQNLMRGFDEIDTVKMRVGALPIHVSNALQYALTWSTDGLINEYIQDSIVLRNGRKVTMPGLSGLETLKIDGLTYEAFHTSGGIGSLVDSFVGRVKHMDYKTVRYPGHCDKMNFLLKELHLENHPEWMKQILENAIPQTTQDMVLIYVSVIGKKDGILLDRHYAKKFYSTKLDGQEISAIQLCTSASACAVVDLLISDNKKTGFVRQEDVDYEQFIKNEFGQVFNSEQEMIDA